MKKNLVEILNYPCQNCRHARPNGSSGRALLIVYCSLLIVFNSFAQFAPFQDESGIITPAFRYDIIRMKKISSIFIEIEEKPDGKTIYNDGIVQYYRFDTAARLIESYYTVKESSDVWDTIRSRYYYDNNNLLITKRTGEGVFFDTWYYVWYANGMLKKEAHVHETPEPGDETDFKIGSQKVISCDSFAYSIYPKQIQRYGFNEENAIYEKVITQYDDNKRMTGRYTSYQVGWLYSQVDLKYDSANNINEYAYSANMDGDVHKTCKLAYDKQGNLLTEKVFVSGKQTHEIEYMYDNSAGLISDKLDRDYDKGIIEIEKFSYTFYNDSADSQ